MSCGLSKELKDKYKCRSVAVRKNDSVLIMTGCKKNGGKGVEGKVMTVYRRRWCIHVEKVQKDGKNGQPRYIPIHPSKCQITKLSIDKSRKILLARKDRDNKGASGADKMD
jgi:large subunit ribosomal protein L26e